MRIHVLGLLAAGCSIVSTGTDPHCTGGKCDGYGGDDPELAIASDLPPQCAGDEIVRISRPIDDDGATPGHFRYGFRYKAPTTDGAPVVVVLPGGPGGAATPAPPDSLPRGWGYLLTDPRGVGCNTFAELPPPDVSGALFRTHEIALDVVAAIADRKLTNYILWGTSYGTALGTTIAANLEATELPAPAAVILQGVLGRAFTTKEFAGAEYITQWERVRAAMPADVRTELDTAASPFGIDRDGWARAIPTLLMYSEPITLALISNLSTSKPADVRQQMLMTWQSMAASHPHTAPGEVELYRQVACRELVDTTPANDLDMVFVDGALVRNVAEEGTKCAGLHVTTPYDSAELAYQAKTYYFLGDTDPATPLWQGAYHFDHHAGPAVRIITTNGGHNSLAVNQASCASAVLASIAAGGDDIDSVLAHCPLPVTVDRH